jgi:protein O-GlcNAc transferase
VGKAYTVQESPTLNGTIRHDFLWLMRFLIKPCAFAFLIIGFQTLFVNRIAHGSYQQGEAEAHADKGLQCSQAGDLEHAEIELRRAVQLAPDNPGFLGNLGTVLAMERKFDDSTKVFERTLELDPTDLTVRRYLAANLWQLHRYREAKRNLELILKAKPHDKPTRLLLGMVSENMKDYTTAVSMLASVPAQVRERPESIAALARSYYHLDAKEKARTTLEELLTHPAGQKGILLGAEIADEMRDYDTAEKLVSSVQPDISSQGTLGYRLAEVQYHAKRFQQSQRTLLDLIASGYKTGKIFNLLGWCYDKQNQVQEAVSAFQEAISLEPVQESNYLDLEKILLANHLLPAALDAAKRTTEVFPDSTRGFLIRGSIEMNMTQFTDAIASYTRAVQLDPAGPDGILGLAGAQSAAGLNQEARVNFEAALKQFPKDVRFKVQYALMMLKEAETGNALAETRAEQLLKSALALDPSVPEVHYQFGNLALRKGRNAAALQNLEQAARLDPQSMKVHFALSRVNRRLGRTEEASRQMDLYLRLKETESTRSAASSADGISPN